MRDYSDLTKKLPRLEQRLIRLANDTLKTFRKRNTDSQNSVKPPYLYFLLALLARITSNAATVFLLLRNGRFAEAIALERSITESYVNIKFVLHDPSKSDHLFEFFVDDHILNICNRITLDCERVGVELADHLKNDVSAKRYFDSRDIILKKPYRLPLQSDLRYGEFLNELGTLSSDVESLVNFDFRKMTEPLTKKQIRAIRLLSRAYLEKKGLAEPDDKKRVVGWKAISIREKELVAFSDEKTRLRMRMIRDEANDHIHGGGLVLEEHLPHARGRPFTIRTGSQRDRSRYRREWVYCSAILLNAANDLVDAFYVSSLNNEITALDQQLGDLRKFWRRNGRIVPRPSR